MDMHDRMRAEVESTQEESEQQYQEVSRERLRRIIGRKVNTSFIGALSKVEQRLGSLWGHGKVGKLTDSERLWKKKYEELRNDILTNGNNQLRAVENEINQYSVSWNRYHTDIQVMEDQDGECQ